jgi:hypothetical protein
VEGEREGDGDGDCLPWYEALTQVLEWRIRLDGWWWSTGQALFEHDAFWITRDGYRARIRNHGHSCFLCEIVIRSQFHTTYEPEA